MNPLHQESGLLTIRDNRRETTGWVSKCNRVLPERLVVNLKLGNVAIDSHGIGIAIDRDGDLLAGVARIGEGKLGLQFVAVDSVLAVRLERNQVSARDAYRRSCRGWGRRRCWRGCKRSRGCWRCSRCRAGTRRGRRRGTWR